MPIKCNVRQRKPVLLAKAAHQSVKRGRELALRAVLLRRALAQQTHEHKRDRERRVRPRRCIRAARPWRRRRVHGRAGAVVWAIEVWIGREALLEAANIPACQRRSAGGTGVDCTSNAISGSEHACGGALPPPACQRGSACTSVPEGQGGMA
eukprot:365372-Chlamydomonas_euryale.AAC.3